MNPLIIAAHGLLEARDYLDAWSWGYSWIAWWKRHERQLLSWSDR